MTSPKKTDAPGSVTAGYWLVVIGMAFVLLTAVFLLINKEVLLDAAIKAQVDPGRSREELSSSLTGALIISLAGDLLLGVLAVWFAQKVKAGLRKARTRLSIVLVLSLFFQLFTNNVLGLVALVVALGGLVALYLRQSTEYLSDAEPQS